MEIGLVQKLNQQCRGKPVTVVVAGQEEFIEIEQIFSAGITGYDVKTKGFVFIPWSHVASLKEAAIIDESHPDYAKLVEEYAKKDEPEGLVSIDLPSPQEEDDGITFVDIDNIANLAKQAKMAHDIMR